MKTGSAGSGKQWTPLRKIPRLEEMGKAVLQGVLGEQAFSIDGADFSKMEDLNSLLTLSLEFEKDTVLFYEMLGAFVEDEKVLEQLEQIIEEENTPCPVSEGPP